MSHPYPHVTTDVDHRDVRAWRPEICLAASYKCSQPASVANSWESHCSVMLHGWHDQNVGPLALGCPSGVPGKRFGAKTSRYIGTKMARVPKWFSGFQNFLWIVNLALQCVGMTIWTATWLSTPGGIIIPERIRSLYKRYLSRNCWSWCTE